MVHVTIQLPDNRMVTGKVDPNASRRSLKKHLIKQFGLQGGADDYEVAIVSKDDSSKLGHVINDGDIIILIERGQAQPPFISD